MSSTPPPVDYTLPQLGILDKLRVRWTVLRHGDRQAWEQAIYHPDATLAAGLRRLGVSARTYETYPVFRAVDLKDSRILKWALDAGMSPNVLEANGHFDYPMHRTAARGWLAKTNLLIEAGASLERRDGNGYTALACALTGWGEDGTDSWERRKPVALRLIEAGTDVKGWQWNDRESYLNHAPLDVDVIKALLKKGANPFQLVNPQPATNYTALDDPGCLLFRGSRGEIDDLGRWLELMREYGMDETTLSPQGNTFAGVVVQRSDYSFSKHPGQALQELEKHGYDLLASNADGDNLLHLWARHQSSMFCSWGDALLAIPGMKTLASQRNNNQQTPADVLLERGEWTTDDMDYVRMLQRCEKRHTLDTNLPDVISPLPTSARLRL